MGERLSERMGDKFSEFGSVARSGVGSEDGSEDGSKVGCDKDYSFEASSPDKGLVYYRPYKATERIQMFKSLANSYYLFLSGS